VDAINDVKAFITGKQWLSASRSPAVKEIVDSSVALGAVSLSSENALIN